MRTVRPGRGASPPVIGQGTWKVGSDPLVFGGRRSPPPRRWWVTRSKGGAMRSSSSRRSWRATPPSTGRFASNPVCYNLRHRGIEKRLLPWCLERGMIILALEDLADLERALPAPSRETPLETVW